MGWHHILLRPLCFLFFFFFLHSSLCFASPLCPPDQRDSLLQFKNSFVVDRMASDFCDVWSGHVVFYPKTNSWNKGADCCSWDGVTCDSITGDVVGLDLACNRLCGALHSNSSLFLLSHLQSLDLSGNNFTGSHISPNLSAFAKLSHLNLSGSYFSGTVPSEISRLFKLVSLDLSYNYISDTYSSSSLMLENSIFTIFVQNLTALRNLVLDHVNMSMVSPKSFANLSSPLTYFSTSYCFLRGVFPDTVFQLSSLTHLDISLNYHMYGILPKFNWTGPLESLYLQGTNFSGEIPNSIGNLKSLTVLVLAACGLTGHIPSSMWNLKQLQVLYLYGNNFSGVVEFENFTKFKDLRKLGVSLELNLSYDTPKYTFPKLEVLALFSCNLTKFPYFLSSLKRLTYLGLSSNRISGEIPKWFWGISHDTLEFLDLSGNLLEGGIHLLHWKRLSAIYLEDNSFQGPLLILPYSTSLFVARNNSFTGEIPSFICQLSSLQSLDLSNNSLSGNIPSCFGNMTNLEGLDLSNNKLQGPLPILPYSTFWFEAQNNCFTGEIPSSICQLSSLRSLYLSNNNFSGNMPSCFGNITNLEDLDLSNNKLQGPLPILPYSTSLFIASNNNFTGEIPSSICQLSSLQYLDLSNNSLSGNLPSCFGNIANLEDLDSSNNKLQGPIPFSFPALHYLVISNNNFPGRLPTGLFSNTSLYVIDLSNNQFGGPLPLPSPTTFYYSIASNKLTGEIPSFICNSTELEVIDLSNNSLTGSLPRCLTNFSTHLSVLNLRMNYLEGTIPQPSSSRSSLMTLDLSRNSFEGTLPWSLVKCRNLEVLDLGDNQIEDAFPIWLGTLPELKVLVLRSNNLKDLLDIPKGAHLFPKLHILDLSNNNFSGPLPANLITNLKGMTISENGQEESLYMTRSFRSASYENSVTVTMKGLEIELVKIFTFLTIIDLSCNSFQGSIPEVIGHLHYLVGLNLSHNHLTGFIPSTLGNLTNLGWLDLSSNKIRGAIPRELGDLASLGYLNLSKNQLTGRIPQDKQLSTFLSDSFGGNLGLCGTPLPKACPGDAQPPPLPSSSTLDHEGHESWSKKKTMWIGYASGIVIGISIAYIAFEMEKPKWLMQGVRMLERRAAEWAEKPK